MRFTRRARGDGPIDDASVRLAGGRSARRDPGGLDRRRPRRDGRPAAARRLRKRSARRPRGRGRRRRRRAATRYRALRVPALHRHGRRDARRGRTAATARRSATCARRSPFAKDARRTCRAYVPCCRSATPPAPRSRRQRGQRPFSRTCSSRTPRTSTSAVTSPAATPSATSAGARARSSGPRARRRHGSPSTRRSRTAIPLVEVASVALIVVIVALAFRSIGAPLVTLFAARGRVSGSRSACCPGWATRFGATVPAEVEPIITVLLLGLVTDYSVFFLSETRQRLREGDGRLEAARGAIRRTAPIVFTAGLIVAAGTGALAVGELGFFRAFGPGLAATTLIALVVSITLVPALLALFGAAAVRRRPRERGPRRGRCRTRTPTRRPSSGRAGTCDQPSRTSRLRRACSRPADRARAHGAARRGGPDQPLAAAGRPHHHRAPRRAGDRRSPASRCSPSSPCRPVACSSGWGSSARCRPTTRSATPRTRRATVSGPACRVPTEIDLEQPGIAARAAATGAARRG